MKTITVPDPANPQKTITLTQVSEPRDIDDDDTVKEIKSLMRGKAEARKKARPAK